MPEDIDYKSALEQASSSALPDSIAQEAAEARDTQASIEGSKKYEHLRGLAAHYRHKRYWSIFIMGVIASMVVFQFVLLGMVGAGTWGFKDYQWLLPALMVQNLTSIIGLALIVVKELFKKMDEMS
jgi:hypothetical protein